MSDVFLSYKTEDRRRVLPLVEALEADGYSVWWDEQIGGGAEWRHAIEAELNAAKCVIVAWSKRSVGREGTFVQDEATRAQQRHVYVPVTIDKVHLPLGFGETQALPLTGWKGDRSDPRYRSVLAAVRRVAGEHTQRPVAHGASHSAVSRRAVLGGGAVTAAAAAGVGGWLLLKPDQAVAADSIAVLPFANLSGDPAQQYFSDGIAEELRGALARLVGLDVAGRTSSEAVRNDDGATAARKLGVRNVLTGSVRQSPSTIRVSAELVDGTTGRNRWSEAYDRAPGDVIKIQTDIAHNVAHSLSAALGSAARQAIAVGGTRNPAAQQLFLQALEVVRRENKASLQRALNLLDGAIALDPGYADAHANKAQFLILYAIVYADGVDELLALRSNGLRSAKLALQLEPNLPAGHRAMAEVYRSVLNIALASARYRRALDLAPGDATTTRDYSSFINRLGRAAESLQLADKALELDPLNAASYANRFYVLAGNRKYEEALAFAEATMRKSPELFDWPEFVGLVLVHLGRFAEAQQHFDRAPADSYNRRVGEAVILIRTGRRGGVEQKVEAIRQHYQEAASYQYGQVYAQLGAKDRAFEALDRAWQIRDSGLLNLKVDRFMDPLRRDSRFTQLMSRLNFPA